jgi:Cellulase (glycosyl hydrolase family 5)
MYASLARAVRAADRGRMVMVEPSYGNASMERADLRLLRSIGNVVLSMHDYYLGGAGEGYMPRGDLATSWQSGGRHSSMDPSAYDPRDARDLERHLMVNVRRMHGAGIPVWIGEFGIDPGAPGGERWIRDKVRSYRRHGVGYAWWLYDRNGSFTPLDRTGALRPFVSLLA